MYDEAALFVDACRAIQRKREAGTVSDADYAELDRKFPTFVNSYVGARIIADIVCGDDISTVVATLNTSYSDSRTSSDASLEAAPPPTD